MLDTVVLTSIPVTVTVLFMVNQAYVADERDIAETASIATAGNNFLAADVFFLLVFINHYPFIKNSGFLRVPLARVLLFMKYYILFILRLYTFSTDLSITFSYLTPIFKKIVKTTKLRHFFLQIFTEAVCRLTLYLYSWYILDQVRPQLIHILFTTMHLYYYNICKTMQESSQRPEHVFFR